MGWDCCVEIDSGNENMLTGDDRNYTHNCNEMMRVSLDAIGELEPLGERHLYALDGKSCAEIGPILQKAMDWWRKQPSSVMAAYEPSNGWGNQKSAYDFWLWVAEQCLDHPLGTLRLSG
jgi:hypothetical protein